MNSLLYRKPLQADWIFSRADTTHWLEAQVPGCVHSDLLHNGVIANPFEGANETLCQWVAEREWVYQTFPFDVPREVMAEKKLLLRFNGLDTYAQVFLNGQLLLKTDNAFRYWEVDVKQFLKPEGNILKIFFYSALEEGRKKAEALDHPLPGDAQRAVTRKPQFHYGWDWGPRLVTCGISKPIELIAFSEARLVDVYLNQLHIDTTEARVQLEFEIEAEYSGAAALNIQSTAFRDVMVSSIKLKQGHNHIVLPFEIEKPKLWWSNGMGGQHFYHFSIELKKGNAILDSKKIRTGLRNIELVTEKDDSGESFYFRLNGKAVYAKGANMIPASFFPASTSIEDYKWLVESCADVHMNMLRVWGGGVYEDDPFYNLCDEFGILIWQDFMFACAMYPADSAFVASVIEEAGQQTKRLRNHPCMALWCGNNEVSEGWQRWGWQDGLTKKEKNQIENAYHDVFRRALPGVVEKNTNIRYWESSPKWGRGDVRYKTEGDAHDWWVWHDEKPFEHFRENIPRFMSEFGFQSFPSPDVLDEMKLSNEPMANDPGFAQHQKHARGFRLMHDYMKRMFPEISKDSIADYAYLSQLVQAEGICLGIMAQRAPGSHCMGSLYWQLNDVWPSFSWSSIDYSGEWKALHYYLKRAFGPLAFTRTGNGSLAIVDEEADTESMLVNEHLVYDINDGLLLSDVDLTEADSLAKNPNLYIRHLVFDQYRETEWREFSDSLKWDQLPQPEFFLSVGMNTGGAWPVIITTKSFAKSIQLSADVAGKFSDNYFDMDAGSEKTIWFYPRYDPGMKPDITVKSLWDCWN